MCYLIAKNVDKVGCVALEMSIGEHLASFKSGLVSELRERSDDASDKIQLVTISRPSAYGEYRPYVYVDSESEFKKAMFGLMTQKDGDLERTQIT